MEPFLYDKFFEVEDAHWWFKARSEIILEVMAKRLALPVGSKVLDIGCGTGGALSKFGSKFDVWGIDTSEQAIGYCRRRGLKNVLLCDVEEFAKEHSDFRLVTLLDVIEHVDDDVSFLKESERALAPDGVVLVTVPAYPFLWSQHDVANHHKRRYTRKTLRDSLVKADLEVVFMSYYNCFLFPLAVLQRFSEKILRTNSSSELELPNKILNSILYGVFRTESGFLNRFSFPFGVSLIAIAAKRSQSK